MEVTAKNILLKDEIILLNKKYLEINKSFLVEDTFECKEKIGSGSFGSVFLAVNKKNYEKYALKKIGKKSLNDCNLWG
jgi:serine/threonine protein kinase